MFKITILSLAAIILLVLAEDDAGIDPATNIDIDVGNDIENDDYELEFPNLNDTDLDEGIPRFQPFGSNEKMYAIVATAQVNWFAAHDICSFRGLSLAAVNTPAESENLRRYLFENGLNAGKNYWLSGTDLASQDNWSWFSSGRPLVFDNFARDVPYNPPAEGASDGNASDYRCMLLRPDGRWIKERCNTPAYFICENRCPLDSYSVPLYIGK